MATGELLSTFFPTWLKGGKRDSYWGDKSAYPVLNYYYPFKFRWAMAQAGTDKCFTSFVDILLLHYLLASIGWYLLLNAQFGSLVAIFGAITFTYQAFHIRQQPCLVYTIAWFPWIAICPWLAIGMILLAGYYPLAIYLLPIGLLLNHDPTQWLLGLAIGSIQLVPFLRHLPKTIKGGPKIATPPWERNCYFGLTPLLLVSWRHLILIPIAMSLYLIRNKLPRVPWRSAIILTYGFIALSLWHLSELNLPPEALWCLVVITCLDLWLHSRLIPSRPWCELYQKPSRGFSNQLVKYLELHLGDGVVSGLPWPLFTGLINNFKTIGYCGSMQTKEMWAWRKSFNHDPFIDGAPDDLEHRVRYAYTRSKPDKWLSTPIRNLYRSPASQ